MANPEIWILFQHMQPLLKSVYCKAFSVISEDAKDKYNFEKSLKLGGFT